MFTLFRKLLVLSVVVGLLAMRAGSSDASANTYVGLSEVSAGGFHTCIVTDPNEGVRCWGRNDSGQLGDGSTTQRTSPTDVLTLGSGVAQVSAGGFHTCAIANGGGVLCWGENNFGQLGDGTTTDRTSPTPVFGLQGGVVNISAGGHHTCAVLVGGSVRCWGRNNGGQLGNGTTTNSSVPVTVTGSQNIVAVSAGGGTTSGFVGHTCALTSAGGVQCWGLNDFGALGDGTTSQRTTPVNVSGLASGAAAVEAGRWHTCARMAAGGVKCWGWNIAGQLGDGTNATRLTPVDVINLGATAVKLGVGGMHTCAVLATERVKCWGSNDQAELGNGVIGTLSQVPVEVCQVYDNVNDVCAQPFTGALFIASGGGVSPNSHNCVGVRAFVVDYSLACWGYNGFGQLGDGTKATRATPVTPQQQPAVILLHGFRSGCGAMDDIRNGLIADLGVPANRVRCVEYDSKDGVYKGAIELAAGVIDFREELGLQPADEVDIVAHSMGGLVARYYREQYIHVGPFGSLSMLGTPNEGSALATVGKWINPILAAIPFVDLDQGGQAITDMAPGSDLLDELNTGFTVPSGMIYKAHAGNIPIIGPMFPGHPGEPGDCIVSLDSATGPNGALAATADEHLAFHFGGCGEPTLTDSPFVIASLPPAITGDAGGGGSLASLSGPSSRPAAAMPFADETVDRVLPAEEKTHEFEVPAGLASATFALYWQDADSNPQLGLTLRRPDGSVVDAAQSDVDEVAITDEGFAYVLGRAFRITSPQDGTWELTVDGTSVPAEGAPYLAAFLPETQVLLALEPQINGLEVNNPQVLTATLFDGETPVAAGASISAEVLTPSSAANLELRDDGTGGDKVSGDLIYTGTFTDTSACGGYRARATATGISATEGTVTRKQLAFFVVHLPGDRIRDPCDTDDDDDALADDAEIDTHLTDPQDADTDDDGCNDGSEVGSNPGQGGLRNPLDVWDFMDQYTGAPPVRDKTVAVGDIGAVVARFGASGDPLGDPLQPPSGGAGYHVSADRSGSIPGQDPWDLLPPDGIIAVGDIGAVVVQFGHSCA
ncbi:MAG: flexitail domain-containing putative surface protein [Dehalococcoidia bacterium]